MVKTSSMSAISAGTVLRFGNENMGNLNMGGLLRPRRISQILAELGGMPWHTSTYLGTRERLRPWKIGLQGESCRVFSANPIRQPQNTVILTPSVLCEVEESPAISVGFTIARNSYSAACTTLDWVPCENASQQYSSVSTWGSFHLAKNARCQDDSLELFLPVLDRFVRERQLRTPLFR